MGLSEADMAVSIAKFKALEVIQPDDNDDADNAVFVRALFRKVFNYAYKALLIGLAIRKLFEGHGITDPQVKAVLKCIDEDSLAEVVEGFFSPRY